MVPGAARPHKAATRCPVTTNDVVQFPCAAMFVSGITSPTLLTGNTIIYQSSMCSASPKKRSGRNSSWSAFSTVYAFLPAGHPKEFLARSCVCLSSSSSPPFGVLDLHNQVPVGPRVLLYRYPFLSLTASTIRTPYTPPPPLPALTGGPVPCRSWVVVLCFLSPRPLCICINLPVFRVVSWCNLKFNSSLDVLLHEKLKPRCLHYRLLRQIGRAS